MSPKIDMTWSRHSLVSRVREENGLAGMLATKCSSMPVGALLGVLSVKNGYVFPRDPRLPVGALLGVLSLKNGYVFPRDPAIVRPVLFKCSRYPFVLAGLCLPYHVPGLISLGGLMCFAKHVVLSLRVLHPLYRMGLSLSIVTVGLCVLGYMYLRV